MTDHAKLSPSKRVRWANCPGSIREEARYPETASSPSARAGTADHALLEKCVKGGLEPHDFIGQMLIDHEGEYLVDRDRADRVKIALDYIDKRVDESVGGCKVLSESRVDPKYLTGRDDLSGTVDIQLYYNDMVEIIDYKGGVGTVDVENNHQLELYALGVLAKYELPVNVEYPIKWIRMTIIQPKLKLKGLEPITSHIVPVATILSKIGTIVVEAAATDKPDAPLVAGDAQCKFCKAKGSCSALSQKVMQEIGLMFGSVSTETPVAVVFQKPPQDTEIVVQNGVSTLMSTESQVLEIAHQAAGKDPLTMTDQQLRQIMEAAPLIRQLLEAVDAEVLRRFKAGTSIEGLKAVNGRGSRSWNLAEDQIAEKLIRMGVPKSAVYETKLVSPAKVEKLAWKKTKAGEEIMAQLSERQLKTIETEYVTKLAGKLTIVPESDPRPAVILDASPLFAPVVSEPVAESLPSWLTGGV